MDAEIIYSEERLSQILGILQEKRSVSVNYLSELFGVSGSTIRTDLTKLEKSGAVIRTHGGAMIKPDLNRELLISERKNDEQKIRIAEKAIFLINEKDTILIDTGTTMHYLAKAIVKSRLEHLQVYTNDLEVARILEDKPLFSTYFLGGQIRNGYHYSFGQQVLEELGRYNFDKLFLATSGMTLSHGLTSTNSELAHLKSIMIKASKQVILLTDSSKIHQVNFARFAEISEVHTLIVDSGLPELYEKKLQELVDCLILA